MTRREHIEALCQQRNLALIERPEADEENGEAGEPGGWSWFGIKPPPGQGWVGVLGHTIDTEFGYWIALHELGHHYASAMRYCLESELRAWEWALNNAIEPLPPAVAERGRTIWLKTYLDHYPDRPALLTQVIGPAFGLST